MLQESIIIVNHLNTNFTSIIKLEKEFYMDYFLSVFGTIISGVLVFVLGQIFIEFFLGPKKEFNELRGKISRALVYYANVYSNSGAIRNMSKSREEVSEELRKLSAELMAFNISKPKYIHNNYDLISARDSLIALSNYALRETDNSVFINDLKISIEKALKFNNM